MFGSCCLFFGRSCRLAMALLAFFLAGAMSFAHADSKVIIHGSVKHSSNSTNAKIVYHKSARSHKQQFHKHKHKHYKHKHRHYSPRYYQGRSHHHHSPYYRYKHRSRYSFGYWPDYHRHGYRHKIYKKRHYYYNQIGFYFPGYGLIKHGHRHGDHCPDWHFDAFLAGAVLGTILSD